MSRSGKTETTPDAHTVESVSQWRTAVESFFATDWDRLRTMIMRLEEELWESEAAGGSPPQAVSEFTRAAGDPGRSDSMVPGNPAAQTREIDTGECPHDQDRLAELARQIEQKLELAETQTALSTSNHNPNP